MTASLRHRIGDRIQERYEVMSVLGSGAFGTVYKCRDSELDTLVAIKELHVLDDAARGGDERESALAQFRREAVNLSNLRHPHIVSGHYQPHSGTWLACSVCGYTFRGAAQCPEHGAAPVVVRQRHYLVMEYLDGPDLTQAALQAGGALEIRQALRYIRQIAEALQLIHGRNLVHRDIKPENIRLRTGSDDAVLLDFGIATQTGEAGDFSTRQHRHTSGGGTPGYAPESANERRLPDARSDIHALGMTLYAVVSGRDPMEPDDLNAMRAMQPRDFNSNVPPTLEALILRSIDSDPARRPQNAADFLRDMLAPATSFGGPDNDGVGVVGGGANGGATSSAATATVASLSATLQNTAVALPSFVFRSGQRASDVSDLVRLMDQDRQEAKEYLYNGDFALWLSQIGRADLAQRAREICEQYPDRKYQGLEALAQATGLVEPPTLEALPVTLDFGTLAPGTRRTLPLKLRNAGRGHLFGILRSSQSGVEFEDKFEGNRHTVSITLDARLLSRGAHHGEIVVDSSAGELRVPFFARVQGPASYAASIAVMGWGVLGMVCGLLLRGLPLAGQGQTWLKGDPPFANPLMSSLFFGLTVWGVLLLLTISEALRRKSWAFLLSAGSLSLPLALLCGAMAGPILIAGDLALRPVMEPLTHSWAAGAWLTAGGLAGAAYGTLRRLTDVFSTRLPQVLVGWLFFSLTLWGVLWVVRSTLPVP